MLLSLIKLWRIELIAAEADWKARPTREEIGFIPLFLVLRYRVAYLIRSMLIRGALAYLCGTITSKKASSKS